MAPYLKKKSEKSEQKSFQEHKKVPLAKQTPFIFPLS